MNKTPIQWTEYTWNPLLGCKETSPGCAECYAARIIGTRFSKNPTLPMYHDIATRGTNGHPHFTGARRFIADRLDEPLRARKGRKVFVCDMGDLFYEGHPFEDIAAVFGVMAAASQHTFQVLTKRAKRMAEFFEWVGSDGDKVRETGDCIAARMRWCHANEDRWPWPLPNVWIGVSTEDQQRADERIPHLLRVPAAVRFLSVEPQIGPVDLKEWIGGFGFRYINPLDDHQPIAWVIQGGESGPRARPFDLAWARSLRDQCRAAGVAYFLKQLGAHVRSNGISGPTADGGFDAPWPVGTRLSDGDHVRDGLGWRAWLHDSHGGDESEWPADLRGLRAFPGVP